MSLLMRIGVMLVFLLSLFTNAQATEGRLLMTIPPILAATYDPPIPPVPPAPAYLDAFKDFTCESNWMSRDGALGLAPYSGDGSCEAIFPNGSGTYNIVLTIQAEFDGRPPYKVSINGQVIKSGVYPLSSSLGCNCPQDSWHTVCPNKKVDIDLGNFELKPGDKIVFWGDDVYPCPPIDPEHPHGAYAEWLGMMFTPVN